MKVFSSEDTCNDPSDNHISVQGRLSPLGNSSHHYDSLGCTSDIPTLQSGEWIRVNIRLLPDTIEIGLGEDDYISVLKIDHIPVLNYLGKERAWIGFTASTGGLSQNHDIQWIHLINL
ncbi:hypothetical protein BDB01DRAFT_419794 [Pilobolus umbonatus]|nr:hypothetical protein BDB01DRAFT_419794 [Pilobolus umbonatus]